MSSLQQIRDINLGSVGGYERAHIDDDVLPRSLAFWMAVGYLAMFIIRPWEVMFPDLAQYRIERVYALGTIATTFCYGFRLRITYQTGTILTFVAAQAMSLFWVENTQLAWDALYKYITLVIFYFVVLSVVRTPYQLYLFVAGYIVVMAFYVGKSEWEYFVHGRHQYEMGVRRLFGIDGTFCGPNDFSASIVMSLPFVWFLWATRPEMTQAWPRHLKRWFNQGLVAYIMLAISAVFLTRSRGAMLAVVLLIMIWGVFGRRGKSRAAGLALALIVLGCLWWMMPTDVQNRLRTVWDPSAGPENAQSSAEGRIEGLKAGLAMFAEQPLTGSGLGHFVQYRVRYIDGVPLGAHNLYGQLLGELGLLGALPFALLVGGIFANAGKTSQFARNRLEPELVVLARLARTCRTLIIVMLLYGMVGHSLYRFNWLWAAAFTQLCWEFSSAIIENAGARYDFLAAEA